MQATLRVIFIGLQFSIKMNSKYLLCALLLIRVTVGQFAGVQNLKQGKEANACAAIVAQCIRRCTQRLDEGITRTEYIQMTIVLVTNDVNCTTEESEEDEMISTDPPNNSRSVVVFNVPCCQQRQLCDEGRIGTGTNAVTTKRSPPDKKSPQICPTITSAESKSDSHMSSTSEKDAITMVVTVFTILNFAAVFTILTLMLWKITKKRKKKTLEPGKQSSPDTLSTPTSNGAVLMSVSKERSIESQQKNKTEETRTKPPNHDFAMLRDDYPPLASGTPFSQNYIVLDTASKSARSRNQGTVEQSPEILIVGGGRYGSKDNKNSLLSNGPIMKFTRTDQEGQETTLTTHRTDIDQAHKLKRNDISKQRSGSSPGTFEITESAYDRLNQMDTEELTVDSVKDLSTVRPRASSSRNRQVGTTSLDRLQPQSIYNVLRGGEELGNVGDYQRLSRTHKRDESQASSLQEFDKNGEFWPDENTYVKEFELLSRRKFSENQAVPATTEENATTNNLYAETIPGSISQVTENGLATESVDL